MSIVILFVHNGLSYYKLNLKNIFFIVKKLLQLIINTVWIYLQMIVLGSWFALVHLLLPNPPEVPRRLNAVPK